MDPTSTAPTPYQSGRVDLSQLTDRELTMAYQDIVNCAWSMHTHGDDSLMSALADEMDRRSSRMCALCQHADLVSDVWEGIAYLRCGCGCTPGDCGHFERERIE